MKIPVILFFALLCISSMAQMPDPIPVALSYDVELIAPETLSNVDEIFSLCQDSAGFYWFGSDNGLYNYDGQNLLCYNSDGIDGTLDLKEKGTGYLKMIKEEGDFLWLVEIESLDAIRVDLQKRKIVQRIEINQRPVSLHKSSNGDIFLISYNENNDHYLTCLNCVPRTHFFLLNTADIYDAILFKDILWISTVDNLFKYALTGELYESFPHQFSTFDPNSNDTLRSSYSNNALAYYWDEARDSILFFQDYPDLFKQENFSFFRSHENVWVKFGRNFRLRLWNKAKNTLEDYTDLINQKMTAESPGTLRHSFTSSHILQNGKVAHLCNNAILLLSPKKEFPAQFEEQFDSGKQIASYRGIAEDMEGNVYASYYGNIIKKEKNQEHFITLAAAKSWPDSVRAPYSLSVWKNKLIWNNLIFQLDKNTETYFSPDAFGDHVNHVIQEDTLWAFVWGADSLFTIDLQSEKIRDRQKLDLITEQSISAIKLDNQTQWLWLATAIEGIVAFSKNGDRQTQFSADQLKLPKKNRDIYWLEFEGDSIWFGTKLGVGLLDRKSGNTQYYRNNYSLPTGEIIPRIIYSYCKDSLGNFYLGTSYGLCYFDKVKRKFLNLSKEHQLASVEFNRNSTFRTSNGLYYFGSIDGLYAFRSEQLAFIEEVQIAKPILNYISVYNSNKTSPTTLSSNLQNYRLLKLKSDDTNIEIDFSSPSLAHNIQYKYRVSEITDEWSHYSKRGNIKLNSFPPGKYKVEVRAYVNIESDNYETLQFEIYKPQFWYKRPWIIALFFILLSSAAIAAIRYRYQLIMENQKRMEALRIKISSDLHDDVGTLLSGIAMRSELMFYKQKSKEKENLKFKELSEMSRKAMDGMRDVVWAIDSRKDKYADLLIRMRSFAEYSLNPLNIAIEFEAKNIEGEAFLDPESRQNYYLIFKEAITNVVRHSNATKVNVQFNKHKNIYTLSIHDNGSQFNPTPSGGLGTSNIKMRAARIGAKVTINTENGYLIKLISEK